MKDTEKKKSSIENRVKMSERERDRYTPRELEGKERKVIQTKYLKG